MSEHPMTEATALEIIRVLNSITQKAVREDGLRGLIVDRDGWESADVTSGLAYAENLRWIKRNGNRVSATREGIEALARSEK